MKNFRHAFTMVEVIFVIVIIGILASVAMVTLAATRDDAMTTRGVSDVKQVVVDVGNYYMTKGEFGSWQDMTNVNVDNKKEGKTRYWVEGQRCILFRRDGLDSITVRVFPQAYAGSTVCKSMVDELTKLRIGARGHGITHTFGGALTK